MPADSVSDLLFSAEARWAGKVGSAGVASDSAQTIPLSSAANLNNGEAYVFTCNRVTSAGAKNELTEMETVIGELSGTNFINCTRGVEGVAQAWEADTVVEILFTATHWSKLVTWAEVAHNQDGTHKSGSVLTLPQINDTTADHQYVLGVSELTADRTITLPLLTGNDDFVFEDHTQTLTNKTLTGPVWDGWSASADTWVYASASAFTIAGVDRTTTYTKGTRLKFTQTTAKYAVVVSSAFSTDTTVTIAVNTDYTIANAAITSPYYSYAANPQGYPTIFNFTPTVTAFSGTITTASGICYYKVDGPLMWIKQRLTITTNGTGSVAVISTIPFTSPNAYDTICGKRNGGVMFAARTNSNAQILLQDYQNAYPASDGAVLDFQGYLLM